MPEALLIIGLVVLFVVLATVALRAGRSKDLIDGAAPVPDLAPDLRDQVARLVNRRQKLQAIKLVIDSTGWPLRDAKAAVQAVERSKERWTVEPDHLAGLTPTVRAELDELV